MEEKELQDTRGSRGKGGTERKEKSIIPRQIDQFRLLLGSKVVQISTGI
jgi:hypothetical protein